MADDVDAIDAAEVSECGPEDVEFTIVWQATGDGGLAGRIEAVGVGAACRLSGKPTVVPLDADGRPLDVHTVTTREWREPGFAELAAGERAVATLRWAGWDGPDPTGRALVRWGPGAAQEATASVTGPARPAATGPATNIVSGWFTRP